MPVARIPWRRLETTAMRHARLELAAELRLARACHALVEHTFSAMGSHKWPEATRVQATLLNQLSLQVRTVTLLAERGYPLQALANVATAYELACALAYIGDSAQRARKWLEHSKRERSFPSTRERPAAARALFKSAGKAGPQLEELVREWEKGYTLWCMAKHGNPRVLAGYGVKLSDDGITLYHGPVGGASYRKVAVQALLRACQLLIFAVGAMMQPKLEILIGTVRKALTARYSRVLTQLQAAGAGGEEARQHGRTQAVTHEKGTGERHRD